MRVRDIQGSTCFADLLCVPTARKRQRSRSLLSLLPDCPLNRQVSDLKLLVVLAGGRSTTTLLSDFPWSQSCIGV